ncbi:MAG: hypothetical protein AB1938_22475 [Myxococcota bacterium]
MRINTFRPQPMSFPTARPATASRSSAATAVDSFEGAAPKTASLKNELVNAAGQVAEQALGSLVEKLMNKLVEKLGAWLDRVLGNKPMQPALPPGTTPSQPTVPSRPVAPTQPAPSTPVGGLTPTPLRKGDIPGVVGYNNTPQNKKIAPRSTFHDAVNAAIDRVREQGIGIDTLDPERNRISNFDAYHGAVVQELLKAGYHCNYDGEELSVGRVGDGHTENFDISTWQGQVRRFYASWQSPGVFDL